VALGRPPDWVQDAAFYQIFPDRFGRSGRVPAPGPLEPWDAPPTEMGFKGGDLYAVVDALDELVDLGIDALYLNPIFASAANHRYHTYDYFRVDPLLGGTPALRALLDAAKGRAVRVVLDGVFNHVGRGFWPFHHLLEAGASSPYRDWFHVDPERLARGRPLLAYPDACRLEPDHPGPLRPSPDGARSLARYGYRAWWDLPALPKLNTDNPQVREYLYGVAEHWLRFGADGWRLDVPEEIADPEFWREFRRRCRAANPEAYLVGEIWHEAPEWLVGDRFDGLMNYPLARAILGYVAAETIDWGLVASTPEYPGQVQPLTAEAAAREFDRLAHRYDPAVVAAQLNLLGSHDTPRFRTIAGGDETAYRLAVVLLAVLPGAPCIYYGDEIGLSGGPDPACRASIPSDRSRWNLETRAFVRALLRLRRASPALRRGSLGLRAVADCLVVERGLETERWYGLLNANRTGRRAVLVLDGPNGSPAADQPVVRLVDLPGMATPRTTVQEGRLEVELPARSAALLAVGGRGMPG
jgi:cyclomaltodextrinase